MRTLRHGTLPALAANSPWQPAVDGAPMAALRTLPPQHRSVSNRVMELCIQGVQFLFCISDGDDHDLCRSWMTSHHTHTHHTSCYNIAGKIASWVDVGPDLKGLGLGANTEMVLSITMSAADLYTMQARCSVLTTDSVVLGLASSACGSRYGARGSNRMCARRC
jgi:hypothetical protein